MQLRLSRSRYVLVLLIAGGLLPLMLESLWAGRRFEVRVLGLTKDRADGWDVIRLSVEDIAAGTTWEIRVPELYAFSAKALPLGADDTVLVVERHYGQSIIVVDLVARRITERIWGYKFSFSPDGTKIVYTYRSSPRVPVGDVVLGYDLEEAKTATPPPWPPGVPGMSSDTPADRGIVLYPPENRTSGKRSPLRLGTEGAVQLASPIAWCSDQRKIAFLTHRHDRTYVVVLDVSRGFRRASVISEMPVDESRFVGRPSGRQGPPTLPPGVHVSAKSLRFTANCESVVAVAWPVSVFAAKEVRVRWRQREPPE